MLIIICVVKRKDENRRGRKKILDTGWDGHKYRGTREGEEKVDLF